MASMTPMEKALLVQAITRTYLDKTTGEDWAKIEFKGGEPKPTRPFLSAVAKVGNALDVANAIANELDK